jgi:sec-independent protein translocase protein TatB
MTELIVIFVVALFVVGPDRLPTYAKKLGAALAQFKKYSDEATKDIKESIVEPLEEAQRPLKEAVEPLNELDKAVRDNVKDVEDSLKGIGKPKKKEPAQTEDKTAPEAEPAQTEDETAPEAEPEQTEDKTAPEVEPAPEQNKNNQTEDEQS